MSDKKLTSSLSDARVDGVTLRGKDLVTELMGHLSFTDMVYFLVTGNPPTAGQSRVLDAVLVTLMDHGLTPHAITARLTYFAAPESIQGAMAAGLLGVGGQFAGTMDGAAALILRVAGAATPEAAAKEADAVVAEFRARRQPLPGFGHPQHRPDDPRTPRLFEIAEGAGTGGRHIAALKLLGEAVDRSRGRHVTINATGAIAAVLLEIDFPAPLVRGVAVISRAGGLLAQIAEERERHLAPEIWNMVEHAVDYDGG